MGEARNEVIYSLYKDQLVYRDLLVDFAHCLGERIEQSKQALAAGKWRDFNRVMHQLRGAAATYGFPALAEVAASLEMASMDGQPRQEPDIRTSVETLAIICQKIEAGMAQMTAEG